MPRPEGVFHLRGGDVHSLSIVIADGEGVVTKASNVTELAYEKAISNLQVFIFEGETLFKYEKITSGMIGSILVIPGFQTMMYPILFIALGIGFIVGTFGSNIAIRNYLRV